MKKVILLLIIWLISDKISAQTNNDKILHYTTSSTIAGASYLLVFKATNNVTISTISSIGLTLGLGFAKELYDMKMYNATWKQSGGDMLFNVLGSSNVFVIRFCLRDYKKTVKPYKDLNL
jgi:hypothetical protein